jgi:hypothetical protein
MHLTPQKRKNYMCTPPRINEVGRSKLNDNLSARMGAYKARERLFSAISAGAFFILIGVIYFANLSSNLWNALIDFFGGFTFAQVPSTGIYLPAPISPASHAVLYNAIFQFCIGLGILQIVMLTLRFTSKSPIGKTAETMGNLVFWFGSAYLITTYLNSTTNLSKWFVFWAGILMILGLSFVARSFVLLAKKRMSS